MSEMVEKVARALSVADGFHPDACSNDEDSQPAWTLYVATAKVAIEAMREPTEIVEEVGDHAMTRTGFCRGVYSAMIDAALKERT